MVAHGVINIDDLERAVAAYEKKAKATDAQFCRAAGLGASWLSNIRAAARANGPLIRPAMHTIQAVQRELQTQGIELPTYTPAPARRAATGGRRVRPVRLAAAPLHWWEWLLLMPIRRRRTIIIGPEKSAKPVSDTSEDATRDQTQSQEVHP